VTTIYVNQPQNQRNFANAVDGAASRIKGWFHKSESKSIPAPSAGAVPGTQTGAPTTTKPVDVYVDPTKYPAAADHAKDAIASGKPDVLTVDRPGARGRRADALKGTATKADADRDEYPPAVTKEGGAGASVKPIPSGDNRGAGASVGQQIKKVPNGSQIKIKVEPKPQS
jgi:hypothetical protein